jgi:hypothetical protein
MKFYLLSKEAFIDQIRSEARRGRLNPIPLNTAIVQVMAIIDSFASGGKP